jgi:hypothetical protein
MKIQLKPQVPSGKIKLNLKPHVNLLQTKDFKERCMGEETQFLMYDGSIKCIADLKAGDLRMSENSTPVKVMSLRATYADMYQINVIKGDSIK